MEKQLYTVAVTASDKGQTMEQTMIERLHTAATSASDIYERDRDRVITLTRELRAAKVLAKRSSARARKLHCEVDKLAKRYNVTSICQDRSHLPDCQ